MQVFIIIFGTVCSLCKDVTRMLVHCVMGLSTPQYTVITVVDIIIIIIIIIIQ